MKKILLVSAAFLSLIASLPAADPSGDEKPPLPGGPLPPRAPDFASWQIEYEADKSTAAAAPATKAGTPSPAAPALLRAITVIKTGTTYHREEMTSSGPGLDEWWMKGFQLTGKAGGPYSFSDGNDGNIDQIDYQLSDFPELDWVGADCYTGVASVDGVKCFVFKKQIQPESRALLQRMPPGAGSPRVEATAWLNLKTALPVQTTIGGRHAIYRFLPPPGAALVFPSAGQSQIQALQSQSAALRRPRVQP